MAVDQVAISSQLQASLTAVEAALAKVDLATASPFQLQPVIVAVNAEIAVIQAAISAVDADIDTDSLGGVVAGNPVPTMWPLLLGQQSDCQQAATLLNALGYLQRLSKNLAQATG